MNKYLRLLIAIFPLFLVGKLNGQQTITAGPDKIVCPGVPTTIGPMTPGSLCYKWEPDDYLSCDECPNPIITFPDDKIKLQYTVFISNDELSISETDKVEIRTGFGPVRLNKNHFRIKVGEEVNATLEKNEGNDPITWSLEGDALGGSIDANGKITGCNKYGKLKVKATKTNDTSCSVEVELEVNHGVKDVHIVDADNDRRVAMNGETLYLIASPNCIIKAIPNDGEEFGDGSPEWYPFSDEENPIPKGVSSQTYSVVENSTEDFSAGDPTGEGPKTYVNKSGPLSGVADIAGFISFLALTADALEEVTDFSKKGPPSAPKLEAKLEIGATLLKITTVEDFDSPALGEEWQTSLGITAGLTGTVYHPQFTHSFMPLGVGVSTALGMTAMWNTTLVGNLTKSDGIENSDDWIGSVNFSNSLSFSVFLNVAASLGPAYTIQGKLEAVATGTFSAIYSESDPENIVLTFAFEPLKSTFGITLEKLTDPKKSENIIPPLSYTLIDKKTFPLGKILLKSYFD